MKLKIFTAILIVLPAFLIALSQIKNKPFAPAEDFPREGALVYLQIDDLPAFIRLWNESKFKEKYLESENFKEFSNSHLGLKLASRWQGFADAAGFPFDFETVGNLTENRAALALYDIGRLDFVFIAPVSDEIFAAAKFLQNQDKFEEQTLEDGTIIYRARVEADSGRQKQELIFTRLSGNLVLASSEKLLAETLKNINGKNAKKNSLADEPSFKILSEKIEPHAAAVWVNQEKLNDDYYFKRYWLMSGADELKNIRAGIFDFIREEGKLIERRKFLLNKSVNNRLIEPTAAEKSLAHLPENVPFYRLQAVNDRNLQAAVRETIFSRQKILKETKRKRQYYSSSDDYYDSEIRDYSSSLGEDFDETIDETGDAEISSEARKTEINYADLLKSASPLAILTFTEPKPLPAPLFIEFRRGAVFSFASTANFNRAAFESAVGQSLSSQLMIASPGVNLVWETKNENDLTWREINAPMTGWQIAYAINRNELILTNNSDFLKSIAATHDYKKRDLQFNELAVLNLEQRNNGFDQIFAQIVKNGAGADFFTGNIRSLLDSAAGVRNIEVKRKYSGSFLDEEVAINF